MRKICKEIGDDITYESTLKRVCRRLFGGLFAGVHPRDKMESILEKLEKQKTIQKTIEKPKYYIFNLDTRAEGGSHWYCWQPVVYSKKAARLLNAAWCLLLVVTPYAVLKRLTGVAVRPAASHWCACVIQDRLVHIYDSFGRDIQNKFRLERQRTKNGRDELWSALYCLAFGVP